MFTAAFLSRVGFALCSALFCLSLPSETQKKN